MKSIKFKLLFLLALFACNTTFGQLTVPANPYTACPNQIVTVTAQWNNVAVSSLTLLLPTGGSGPAVFNTLTFTVSNNNPSFPTFTLIAAGNGLSGPVTNTAYFNVNVTVPPPLSMTYAANYCPGSSVTIVADPGGSTYSVTGPGQNNVGYSSNVIIFPAPSPGPNNVYQVTSYGSCTVTGTATIFVAPNNQISTNTASNVCEGGTVALTANMNLGTNFQWYEPLGSPMNPAGPAVNISNIQPNQAGPYLVTADIAYNGITCPRSATVQVNVVPTNPVAVAASPNNVLCQGDKLSLSAGAGGAVGFNWTGPASFATSLANPTIYPVGPQNSGNYSVTAFFTNNFVTCSTSAVVNVSVVPVTQPVITMPSSICQKSSISFSASAGPNVVSWTWIGPSYTASTQQAFLNNAQPNQSGTYYVTAGYALGSTTCAATASTQLNVVQVDSVSVIPPSAVCVPNNAYLQASANGAIGYAWVGPNSYSATGSNPVVYYPTPAASGVYTVTASFGGGNLVCKNTNTVSLSVYPVLNFSLVPRQQSCYNEPLQVVGPSGATSYSWTSSTGFTSNDKDLKFTSIQPNQAGTYTLNVSLGPCVTSGSTTIEVLTPISATLMPKDRTVCRGDTVVLEAGVTGGSENYAYMWNPSIYLDTPTGPFHVIEPEGTVIYNLIVHDIACPSFSLSHSFSVNVNQPPKPNITLPRTTGCAPFCLSYDAAEDSTKGIVTFDFGGLRVFQWDTIHQYCIDEPGVYNLKIYSKGQNGCSGTYDFPYPLVVNPSPGADIHWSPEQPTTAEPVTFYASFKDQAVLYHNWVFKGGEPLVVDTLLITGPDSDSSNADSPTRNYHAYGKYPVMLTAINEYGCIDTVVKFVNVIDEMALYIPNSFTPNGDGINDKFGVKGIGIKTEGFLMQLCDRTGTVFFTTKDMNEWWDGKIGGVDVMSGIYIYKIRAVGQNGEGRKEYIGYFSLLR